jgi:hypothetical protein
MARVRAEARAEATAKQRGHAKHLYQGVTTAFVKISVPPLLPLSLPTRARPRTANADAQQISPRGVLSTVSFVAPRYAHPSRAAASARIARRGATPRLTDRPGSPRRPRRKHIPAATSLRGRRRALAAASSPRGAASSTGCSQVCAPPCNTIRQWR